jgi:redox-sensing transcriptional repressor
MSDPKGKPGASGSEGPVPKAVVNRLSLYLRELEHLVRDGHSTISSSQLGARLGFTDAQVRKDLAYFGHFGYPGIGYRCEELIAEIKRIMGTDQQWAVALVGVGNLGRALLGYRGFQQRGFRLVAAFDSDTDKVGDCIEGVTVYHLDQLPEIARQEKIRLALLAVPATQAQIVAERLAAAGVEGVLNFAPVTIMLGDQVSQIGVDLAIELEQLSFSVANRESSTEPDEPPEAADGP